MVYHTYTCISDTLYIQSGKHLFLSAWSAGDAYLSFLFVPVDVSADEPLQTTDLCNAFRSLHVRSITVKRRLPTPGRA